MNDDEIAELDAAHEIAAQTLIAALAGHDEFLATAEQLKEKGPRALFLAGVWWAVWLRGYVDSSLPNEKAIVLCASPGGKPIPSYAKFGQRFLQAVVDDEVDKFADVFLDASPDESLNGTLFLCQQLATVAKERREASMN